MWPPKKILCPTDFSEGSDAAISLASELAIQFGAEIYLLHVVPIDTVLPTDPPQTFGLAESNRVLHDEAEKHLQGIAQPLQTKRIPTRAMMSIGDAATATVDISEREQIDLIVIATYGKTGWRRLAFGSVTEKVVRLATCPVLTIPGRFQGDV